jgi:hypothetical protein
LVLKNLKLLVKKFINNKRMEKIKLTEEEKNRISILHKINLSEDFKINFEVITPEELKKFKESLTPIKTAACLSNKKRCKKCIEMISSLETGKVSNRLIEKCFNCEFGTNTYEMCEELKGKFKSILIDIQREKGMDPREKDGKLLRNTGEILGFLTTLRMIIQDTTNLFRKNQNPSQ